MKLFLTILTKFTLLTRGDVHGSTLLDQLIVAAAKTRVHEAIF